MTSCYHQYADGHGNCEGSVESTVQVTAKDKFPCGVRCLVKPDTIVGCEYCWCGMEPDGGNCVVCVHGWQVVGMVSLVPRLPST